MSKAARVKRRQARNLSIGPEKKIVTIDHSSQIETLECSHLHPVMPQVGQRPAKYRRCEKCRPNAN